MYNIFFKYSVNIFIRLQRARQYIIVNHVSTFFSFCERKISLRKGITFFFIIESIHLTSLSFPLGATLAYASAWVLAAKMHAWNDRERRRSHVHRWFMMIINYSETDTSRRWLFVLSCFALPGSIGDRAIYRRNTYFAPRTARKLSSGQILQVCGRNRYVVGDTPEARVTNGFGDRARS